MDQPAQQPLLDPTDADTHPKSDPASPAMPIAADEQKPLPSVDDEEIRLTTGLVREELKKVIDPELFVNIVDLGLVYVIGLEQADDDKQKVKIEMTMTSPACPAGPQLIAQSKMVVKQLPGVSDCEVRIVMDPPWTPDKMTEEARDSLGIF
jgi:metal-sulfur cluster biosynthetic enzyme